MSVDHIHAVPSEAGREYGFPGTRVTDSCDLLCGYFGSSLASLEQQDL